MPSTRGSLRIPYLLTYFIFRRSNTHLLDSLHSLHSHVSPTRATQFLTIFNICEYRDRQVLSSAMLSSWRHLWHQTNSSSASDFDSVLVPRTYTGKRLSPADRRHHRTPPWRLKRSAQVRHQHRHRTSLVHRPLWCVLYALRALIRWEPFLVNLYPRSS